MTTARENSFKVQCCHSQRGSCNKQGICGTSVKLLCLLASFDNSLFPARLTIHDLRLYALLSALCPALSQSDEGIVFGSWMVISLSQQVSVPSPGFVERASVPQTSHLYRFPSLLGMVKPPYFLSSMGWLQHVTVPFPPRVMITSAPHFAHMYRFPTVLAIGTTSLYVRYSSISLRSGAMISFGSVTDWISSGVRPG